LIADENPLIAAPARVLLFSADVLAALVSDEPLFVICAVEVYGERDVSTPMPLRDFEQAPKHPN
jgi:hypothetical protein